MEPISFYHKHILLISVTITLLGSGIDGKPSSRNFHRIESQILPPLARLSRNVQSPTEKTGTGESSLSTTITARSVPKPSSPGTTIGPAEDDMEVQYHLKPNYNKQAAPIISIPQTLPNGTRTLIKKPVTCLPFLNIRSVRDIDEAKEQVTLDMDLFISWPDTRIIADNVGAYTEKNLTKYSIEVEKYLRPLKSALVEKIWIPDLFFEEVVSVARPIVLDNSGKAILFNPKIGIVGLRTRGLFTLHCDMNFIHYPADTQRCEFHLRSDAYDSAQLVLKWYKGGVYLQETSDPNFDYQVSDILQYDKPTDLGPLTRHTKPFSYLWFEIRFRRKMSYHLLQTYLPSVFFLVVTWLCFLIPAKMFEARVGVAMTTLLTQTSMFSSIRESTPIVGYVKAIDVWMVTCILFIFLALLIFTVAAWVRHARERLRQVKAEAEELGNRLRAVEDEKKPWRLYRLIDRDIEKYAVISLSMCFVVFATVYWSWLLVDSDHLNWNVNETFNRI